MPEEKRHWAYRAASTQLELQWSIFFVELAVLGLCLSNVLKQHHKLPFHIIENIFSIKIFPFRLFGTALVYLSETPFITHIEEKKLMSWTYLLGQAKGLSRKCNTRRASFDSAQLSKPEGWAKSKPGWSGTLFSRRALSSHFLWFTLFAGKFMTATHTHPSCRRTVLLFLDWSYLC